MKTLFTALLIAVSVTCSAQSLFQTVMTQATAIVNNPNASDDQQNIAQFKVTALNYISMMVTKRGLDKDTYFYDSQAVNLASFVTDYLLSLEKANSPAVRQAILKCYQQASIENPLFKDTNKEKVNCYVADKTTRTPFSLDTDWEKAYDQATKNIKSILK